MEEIKELEKEEKEIVEEKPNVEVKTTEEVKEEEGFVIDGKKVESMEDFVKGDLDEESKELYEQLVSSGMNPNVVMANQMERIFKSAYTTFCNSNKERIKFFIEATDRPEYISSEYDIEIDNVKYHWKEDLFYKSDEFNSTELGNVPLYILNYEKIHLEVQKMDNSLFDELKESYEKENGKTITYEELKNRFNIDLEDIAERIRNTVTNAFLEKKINYADKDAVDKIFNEENFNKSKVSLHMSIKDMRISLNSYRNKLIKKITKDLVKNKRKVTDNDKEVITVMTSQMAELFAFAILRSIYDTVSLENIVNKVKEIEDKENIKKLFLFTNLITYKMMYHALFTVANRVILPALVTRFYKEEDIEKSYIFTKLLDLGENFKDEKLFDLKLF